MQPTDPSKFTEQAWDAIVKSQEVARRYRNQNLEVEHLLLSLLEQESKSNKTQTTIIIVLTVVSVILSAILAQSYFTGISTSIPTGIS